MTTEQQELKTIPERVLGAWEAIKAERRYIQRAEWRKLGTALREKRIDFIDDATFSIWCNRNGLKEIRPPLRLAAMQFSAAWSRRASGSAAIPLVIREWHRERVTKRPREPKVVTEMLEHPREPEVVTVTPEPPQATGSNHQIAAMLLEAAQSLQRSAALLIQVAQAMQIQQ